MRHACSLAIATLFVFSAGCASMCDSSLDCDFHAFGGMRDRHDRVNGRVASLFEPAAALESDASMLGAAPYDPDSDGFTNDSNGPVDGSVEDSGLTDELMNRLKEFDDLPEVPEIESDSI